MIHLIIMTANLLNSGRKPTYVYSIGGQVFTSLNQASATIGVHKTTIIRRCNDVKNTEYFREPVGTSIIPTRKEIDRTAQESGLTPLEYMLNVMNDPGADERIRAQMANWAAPYVHPKASVTTGKKQEREEKAKQAGTGRFSASQPPKLKALK